jgi:predicted enzyme related to lactoylglutathione lyase
MSQTLQGLRTVIYKTPDLERAKEWYRDVFGIEPYFDQPFYVGFNVGGFELGLDPDIAKRGAGAGGSTAYWGVANLADTLERLKKHSVSVLSPLQDVGEGIKVATIADPFGNTIGLIENPHFGKP